MHRKLRSSAANVHGAAPQAGDCYGNLDPSPRSSDYQLCEAKEAALARTKPCRAAAIPKPSRSSS
jgi:hypothetical protein